MTRPKPISMGAALVDALKMAQPVRNSVLEAVVEIGNNNSVAAFARLPRHPLETVSTTDLSDVSGTKPRPRS